MMPREGIEWPPLGRSAVRRPDPEPFISSEIVGTGELWLIMKRNPHLHPWLIIFLLKWGDPETISLLMAKPSSSEA